MVVFILAPISNPRLTTAISYASGRYQRLSLIRADIKIAV